MSKYNCNYCNINFSKKSLYNKHNKDCSKQYTFIDLCCGTGAFSYILEKYNYKCVLSNDILKSSFEINQLNNNSPFILENLHNINLINIPNHFILCAGFPCQSFSIAGKQKGFDDERSNIFWKILEILKYHKPSIIILENVKNLVSHDKGNTYKIIIENLKSVGYIIKDKILDTSKITNIPHHRERIYIVGFLNKDLYNKFDLEFPICNNNNIIDYLENNINNKYYYTKKLKVFDTIDKEITKNINTNTLYQYRRYYVRENKSNCCPTLTENMGSGGHNVPLLRDNTNNVRKLTPRECFNLQGFPINYKLPNLSDTKLYKLAGNAVSVPVIELIIKKINNILIDY